MYLVLYSTVHTCHEKKLTSVLTDNISKEIAQNDLTNIYVKLGFTVML